MYLKVLELPLNVMKLSGINPSQNTCIAKILSILALACGVTTFITAIIEMCYVERTIVTFAPAAETFFASLECFPKVIILLIFKKKLSVLVDESKTFWNVDEADPNEETPAKAILLWIWNGIKFLLVCTTAAAITLIIAAAVFSWGKSLPFEAWFPRDLAYGYAILYVTQSIYLLTSICVTVGSNGVFAAFCGQLTAQFKLLNRKLQNTNHIKNDDDYLRHLENCIRYHIKLLNFAKKMGVVFSGMLLAQYLVAIGGTCLELFLVSEKLDDPFQIASFLTITGTLMVEMGIFCFMSEIVTDESLNVGWAVYSSDWHSRDIRKVDTHVRMIIRRALKPVTFSAGGLLLMRRVLWFNIFKMAVSLFTLITSLK